MKPKLLAAVKDLHAAEVDLAEEYRTVGERHAADHDVFHICETLADQCDAHAELLRSITEDGAGSPPSAEGSVLHAAADAVRRKASAALSRTSAPGMLLLHDLRHLYGTASDCEIAWTIVAQGAKAGREAELVALSASCCEETVGQLRWIKTRVKLAAPQVLSVG